MRIFLHLILLALMTGLVSCASDNQANEEVSEESMASKMDSVVQNYTQSISKDEEISTYLSMTEEQYEDFFRNTRLGIEDAISSNNSRLEKLKEDIAGMKTAGDTESKTYERAQNLLKNAQSRAVKLNDRLKNFDAKIKSFNNVVKEERPQFITELKEILKS